MTLTIEINRFKKLKQINYWLKLIFVHFTLFKCVNAATWGGNRKDTTSNHYLKLDKFEACDDALNAPMVSHPAEVFLKDNFAMINFNVSVKENLPTDLESIWIIEKCVSKEAPNTCQQFYKIRSARYCHFLEAKGEMWTSMIDCLTPRYECPFKKGMYIGKNCKVDLSLFKLFPLQNLYWKAKIIINDNKTKRMLSCSLYAGGMAKI